MRAKIYLRVAKSQSKAGFRVVASVWPNYRPLENSERAALPTAAFALMLDIPDEKFAEAARVLAEIEIPEEAVGIAVEVPATEGET